MDNKKFCPRCGKELSMDSEFCTECGFNINSDVKTVASTSSPAKAVASTASPVKAVPVKENSNFNGFFDNLSKKTSFPILVFAFVIFGVFLFIGSIVWGSLLANQSINFSLYLFLTIIFSVFFAGVFIGFVGCIDKSYVFPNFALYLGSIVAILLCGFGFLFSIIIGFASVLSSIYNPLSSGGSYYGSDYGSSYGGSYSGGSNDVVSSAGSGLGLDVIIYIFFIPLAAYAGVYLGYLLKNQIK